MADQPAWHEAFPAPRSSPGSISREELLEKLKKGQTPGRDFLMVDVRRTDHEGGTIRGSLNLPAQSLYPSLPTLWTLCNNADVKLVIWYCGSCGGRGPRAAGWFADLIEDHKIMDIQSVILAGGIKGWVKAGDEYTQMMEGYNKEAWG